MNPNGILFGPNASLDIGGSFIATTANAIEFPDGSFGAASPQSDSLLTVNVPMGLQYGKEVQPIIVNGSNLQVRPDQTLALVGGNVSLESAQLSVFGGRLELGGLAETGTVGLTFENNIPHLSILSDVTRGNILVNSTRVYSDDPFGNGAIVINAKDIDIKGNSTIRSGRLFATVGGDITLNATNNITVVDNSRILSFVGQNFQGNSGDIEISAGGSLFLSSALISSLTYGYGRSGDIKIATGSSLLLNNGSQIGTATLSDGYAGDINITTNSISLDDPLVESNSENSSSILSFTGQDSSGGGGNINIFARELSLKNGGVSTSTLGQGNAGSINIFTEVLRLSNASSISTVAFDSGDSGKIEITATDRMYLDTESQISNVLGQSSSGNGEGLRLTSGSIFINNGASVTSGALGSGTSGDIIITAKDKIQIDGASPTLNNGFEAVSNIANFPLQQNGQAQVGDVVISTSSLWLTNGGAILSTQTSSTPTKRGNINITANEAINILGASERGTSSTIRSTTQTNLAAGDITIKSPVLNISSQGMQKTLPPNIFTGSGSTGNAGKIWIEADLLNLNGGLIWSTMNLQSQGEGGSITIKGSTLDIANGGYISTSTFSSQGGKAGDINITLSENLRLSGIGSGIFASAGSESTGNGGNIFIDPPKVTITDGAMIASGSLGSGNSGNISLLAGSLELNNGKILAITGGSNGGNVNLTVRDLLFANNNSTISATAGGNGDGGNLTINADLILLNGNSDLTANALYGKGGNIKITTQGIFQSFDSDITASSDLGIDGTVQINTPGIDPNRGLVNLPENIVDASGLVSQRCSTTAAARGNQQSEFIVTGRGGLPSNPSEPLQNESVLTNWITLNPDIKQAQQQTKNPVIAASTVPEKIVVAQGASVDKDGTIVLLAPTSNPNTGVSPWQAPVKCHGS
jgi:large exoprotein involved in heme utilization and adhesion